MEGKKFDSGKPQLSLLPPHATVAVGRVLTTGAQKYKKFNWLHVPGAKDRYADAALRHIFSKLSGEDLDPETGENHLAHAICCLMFLLDAEESGWVFPEATPEKLAESYIKKETP